ncbi:histidinol-phosphatase HisJ [Alteribacillus sp. HJP-4]|uniref:histidinol-phosphatase HisJ n=1 Tax=Alteribacillus sp. HJP-4 TaxID=2775394 RepID=UPI0035CD1CBF
MLQPVRDGHIHTPYCPHGSADTFSMYVEEAVRQNLHTITFTEHAPLPHGFEDPVPEQNSAMDEAKLADYFQELRLLKKEYSQAITILAGLEVDFIEGYEKETEQFLNEIGPDMDDSILSVHFLRTAAGYICLDYSPDSFEKLIEACASSRQAAKLYYDTLLQSINQPLGPFKPRRIGHMTLAAKFQHKFSGDWTPHPLIETVLDAVHKQGLELDYNGAGTAKVFCREPYPPDWVIKEAKKRGIPLVYGSDAHQARDLGQGIGRMLLST